ncbi:MAG: hypothetical protein OHK0052_14610 [Anaerolineales bacterium]
MMQQTKLTIRLPESVVALGKDYARRHNTSLTRLVEAYLSSLAQEDEFLAQSPLVQRLSGTLSPRASLDAYRLHLEEKHE